ncbi:hypothetical protein HYPSUDRAFT_209946 [Hypholoma sublateritium FD-334 SS-4]|uniref:Uncharacterized protein n=1 Tax=Hypholoma sublateritium (strain FD-334 SS-4) TaxID=945553 RepID=A0A0D2N879_HYPSF|nr:hypothetical protein HYPSUDRAFT_209946 [Hypholoma sublateritium FD-334 SS-4]
MLSHFPQHRTAAFAPRDAPGHPLSAASITGVTIPPEDEDNGAHLAAFVGLSPIHESPSARTSPGAYAHASPPPVFDPYNIGDGLALCVNRQAADEECALHMRRPHTPPSRTGMNTDANDAPSLAVAAAVSSYRFYDSGSARIGGTCNELHVPLHVLRRPCLSTTTAMLACQRSPPHVLLDLGAHRRRPSTSAQQAAQVVLYACLAQYRMSHPPSTTPVPRGQSLADVCGTV